MTLEISQVMCFVKSLSWYDLLEKLHVTVNFLHQGTVCAFA